MDYKKQKIGLFDYHVHIGQFEKKYFAPRKVIKALYRNNIFGAYISSTTSCMAWNNEEEKTLILRHIHDEIMESILSGQRFGIDIIPLYWVIPSEIVNISSLQNIFEITPYAGFKIHPKSHDWNLNSKSVRNAMDCVCLYAKEHNFPILIHTGYDEIDSPKKFLDYFVRYPEVEFILAHCKNVDEIIDIFLICKNVYGDTSFCPEGSFSKILKRGFEDRMLYGTDFPIFSMSNKQRLIELYSLMKKNNVIF